MIGLWGEQRTHTAKIANNQLESKKAMELATAMETADKNARDLKKINGIWPVKPVTKDPPKGCVRCRGRFRDKWRYNDEECTKCSKQRKQSSKNKQSSKLEKLDKGFWKGFRMKTHITWVQQKRLRKTNTKNARCFTSVTTKWRNVSNTVATKRRLANIERRLTGNWYHRQWYQLRKQRVWRVKTLEARKKKMIGGSVETRVLRFCSSLQIHPQTSIVCRLQIRS